ncbi:MAG TPA: hypothetical protein VIC84_15250 [Blastocatellia bacterium]
MSAQDKAANLFEYISKVYAIDLPVARLVTGYDDLLAPRRSHPLLALQN